MEKEIQLCCLDREEEAEAKERSSDDLPSHPEM